MSELFANRRDMLHKRVRSFTPGVAIDAHTPEALIEEFFAPGRPDALQKPPDPNSMINLGKFSKFQSEFTQEAPKAHQCILKL